MIAMLVAQSSMADLVWGSPEWAWPALAVGIVLSAIVAIGYARRDAARWVRSLAAALKIAAIGLLALCLVQPMKRGTRPRPQANIMAVMVDTSQSMRIRSPGQSTSRFEQVSGLIQDDQAWRTRLAQSFDVRTYGFDSRMTSIDDVSSLAAQGRVSSIAGSLRRLSEQFQGRPISGVLLFSDGNLTDSGSDSADWSDLGFPVYPVVTDRDDAVRDLRIADVGIRQTDFESTPTTVSVSLAAIGMAGQTAVVRISTPDGKKTIEERTVSLGTDDVTEEATFRFRPDQAGTSFFAVSVFTESDRESIDQPDLTAQDIKSGEVTLANNRRLITVRRSSGPYRILYLSGRPNWEFKFLRRALQSDAEIQLVGLIRIADKEPKFSFRDRGVSETNPLFAGLGKDEEELASQYDEPVILRFGVRESEELSDGFPESDEELFAYQAVILDDIESQFFSQDQLLRLRRFVAARGGGLMFLGGQESFAKDGFYDTPLGELSPVYQTRGDATSTGPYQVELTREGLLQPWMRLRDTQTAEDNRLRSMPPFATVNRVGEVKPGASLVATAKTVGGDEVPAMVIQRFGKGRSAAVPLGDLWRWAMRRGDGDSDRDQADAPERQDPEQAWRQWMHWLVNDAPRRTELVIDAPDDPSQPVSLAVAVRDEAYLPLDNAVVELTIVRDAVGDQDDPKPLVLRAQSDDDRPGIYSAEFWSRESGTYRATAKVTAADGSEVGEAATGWASNTGSTEFSRLTTNRDWLSSLAQQTGGETVTDDELDSLVTDLPNRKVPVTETWVYPLWHQGWVLFAALACLCGEWGLRRWKGLA